MKYKVKKTFLSLAEMTEVVNNAVDVCFITDEEGNDVDYVPEYKEVSLQAAFCEKYLDLELSEDFDETYNVYMNIDIYDYLGEVNKTQWGSIETSVDRKIEYRKDKLLQPKSESDEMFKKINMLLDTANSKLGEFDIKSIEKIFKKLNVKELAKAYKNSGLADNIRDSEISKLAKENKELKNQVTARNVKVK